MTEIYINLENSTCDPVKYKMDKSMLIVSICMGKIIRVKRVELVSKFLNFTNLRFK